MTFDANSFIRGDLTTAADIRFPYINVKAKPFAAMGDGRTLSDITTTASSVTISSASYSFASADAGKAITIAGAGASGVTLNTTIASATGGVATLAVAAGTSVAGTAVATFGTNDAPAFQAAIAAAVAAGGGTVYMPAGVYVISASLTWASKVSLIGEATGKSALKWISASDMTAGMIQGLLGSPSNPYTDNTFRDFEMDMSAATQAAYNVAGKGFYIQYMQRPRFQNLFVHDSPATGIGADFMSGAIISGCTVQNCGRLNNGSGLGGAGIGIGVGSGMTESYTVLNNNVLDCKRYGIFFEAQTAAVAVNSWARVLGNYVHMSATSLVGIADAGLFRFLASSNTVVGVAGSGDGISSQLGSDFNSFGASGSIIGNSITGTFNGISLVFQNTITQAANYNISGNDIHGVQNHGIYLFANGSVAALSILNNVIRLAGVSGIESEGGAVTPDLILSGNVISDCGQSAGASANKKAGITLINTISRLRMVNNVIFDDQATKTQNFGLTIATTVAAAFISGNDLSGNGSAAINLVSGGITGSILNNKGYNPVGAIAVTVGASPWTYTAGNTIEELYINGGTVSAVAKNGVTLAAASPARVTLYPGEAVTVTYSAAPTAASDRK